MSSMESNHPYQYMDKDSASLILLCIICKSPFEEPRCAPCNHIFCRRCIVQWIRTNTTSCPACRQWVSVDSLSTISPVLCKMLDTLPVKCTLCGQENIERGNFSEHINNSCPNARVSCHCPDVRCPWIGNRSELQHHLSTCYFHPFRSTFDTIFAEQRELREQNEQLRADMHRQNTELVDRLSQGFNRHEAQINTLINQLAGEHIQPSCMRYQTIVLLPLSD